jgi:hypothetical protein
MRRIEQPAMLATDSPPATEAEAAPGGDRPSGSNAHGIAPIGFTVLLLVLATTSQGAFAISRWAPLALFALALLIGVLVTRGGFALGTRHVRVALGGIWGLAAWSLLSMLWAKSSADALVGADEMILYAAIATLPFALPLSRRSLAGAGWALAAGIGLVAVYVLIRLLANGPPLFLAGRLNGPVNYRNATALLFALPVWPFIVATAARTYSRALRALAFALATLCLALVFLTQSRGILLGLAIGGCVAMVLGPDRVRRAWVAALALAGVAAASHWLLAPFHAFDGGHGVVGAHDIAVAARATALLTLVAFVAGMLIALFDSGLRPDSPQMRHTHQAARAILALGVVAALAAALIAVGNPVSFVNRKWDQFQNLNAGTPTTTRYASVSGQRYDLWRVAVKEFGSAPLLGVGAQNYSFGYYVHRRTNRNLDDPHSLVFSLLSETGAVGVVLFATFLIGIALVLRSGWRDVSRAERRHVTGAVAAGGVLLGQTAVDWIWLIPGLTAVGVLALAIGAAQVAAGRRRAAGAAPGPTAGSRSAWLGRAPRIATGALLAVAVVAVLSVYISNAYIQRARSASDHPQAELSDARTASAIDPWSVTPHYLEASAYETLGQRTHALAQLNDALKLEPDDFATLGVLGDFEVRGGNLVSARGYYRRALALNPLDTGLQQLARMRSAAAGARR